MEINTIEKVKQNFFISDFFFLDSHRLVAPKTTAQNAGALPKKAKGNILNKESLGPQWDFNCITADCTKIKEIAYKFG